MHYDDIAIAREMPGFARILAQASVAEVEGVYPSLTYPNHAAQITGCPPATSGVYNNTQFQPWARRPEWFWDSRLLQVPTIFAAARAGGLTTAAVLWRVTVDAPDAGWPFGYNSSPLG